MSSILIGFLLGCGVAAWVYNKLMRSSGGNSKQAGIVAAMAGVGGFLAVVIAWAVLF